MSASGRKRPAEDLTSEKDKMARPNRTPPRTRKNSMSSDQGEDSIRSLLTGMEDRLMKRMDNMENTVTNNMSEIKEVRGLLCTTESNLLERMDQQKRELEAKIAAVAHTASGGLTPRQEEAYWQHRRALKVWPCLGEDAPAGLKAFLMKKLRFSEAAIRELGPIQVSRAKDPRGKKRHEAICTFETKEARDTVKRAGINLAKEGQEAGMSIHVPGFLLDDFYLLQSVGWSIKESTPNTRRSIKFDDSNMSLMIDVKIGDTWKRIKPEEAKKAAKANADIRGGPKEMTGDDIISIISTPTTGANSTPLG